MHIVLENIKSTCPLYNNVLIISKIKDIEGCNDTKQEATESNHCWACNLLCEWEIPETQGVSERCSIVYCNLCRK